MSFTGRLNLSGGSKNKEAKRNATLTSLSQLAIARQQQALAKQQLELISALQLKSNSADEVNKLKQQIKEQYHLASQQIEMAKGTLTPYINLLKNRLINAITKRTDENKDKAASNLICGYANLTHEDLIKSVNETLLGEELAEQFVVTYLGGSNNRSLLVSDSSGLEICVIQFAEISESAKLALDKLDESGKGNSNFFAKNIFDVHVEVCGSADNNPSYFTLAITEMFESLEKKVADLHNLSTKNQHEKIIEYANMVGKQVIDLLLNLRKEKILWTDLKPSNILVDNLGHIKITDPKALLSTAKSYQRNRAGHLEHLVNTTEDFLSTNFISNRDKLQDRDVFVAWTHEYSHQLAILLHYICTEQVATTPHKKKDVGRYEGFNFQHPVYDSKIGKRLKLMIQLLSGEAFHKAKNRKDSALSENGELTTTLRLNKRIDLDDAAILFDRLYTENGFKEKLEAVLVLFSQSLKDELIGLAEIEEIKKDKESHSQQRRGLSYSARLYSEKKHTKRNNTPTLPPLSFECVSSVDSTESENESEEQDNPLRAKHYKSKRRSHHNSSGGSRTERHSSKQNSLKQRSAGSATERYRR